MVSFVYKDQGNTDTLAQESHCMSTTGMNPTAVCLVTHHHTFTNDHHPDRNIAHFLNRLPWATCDQVAKKLDETLEGVTGTNGVTNSIRLVNLTPFVRPRSRSHVTGSATSGGPNLI